MERPHEQDQIEQEKVVGQIDDGLACRFVLVYACSEGLAKNTLHYRKLCSAEPLVLCACVCSQWETNKGHIVLPGTVLNWHINTEGGGSGAQMYNPSKDMF